MNSRDKIQANHFLGYIEKAERLIYSHQYVSLDVDVATEKIILSIKENPSDLDRIWIYYSIAVAASTTISAFEILQEIDRYETYFENLTLFNAVIDLSKSLAQKELAIANYEFNRNLTWYRRAPTSFRGLVHQCEERIKKKLTIEQKEKCFLLSKKVDISEIEISQIEEEVEKIIQ